MSRFAILIVLGSLLICVSCKSLFQDDPNACVYCHGRGWYCSVCNGTTWMRCYRCGGFGYDQSKRCPGCHGTGRIEHRNAKDEIKWRVCDACNGRRIQPCAWCGKSGKVICNAYHKRCEICDGIGKSRSYTPSYTMTIADTLKADSLINNGTSKYNESDSIKVDTLKIK